MSISLVAIDHMILIPIYLNNRIMTTLTLEWNATVSLGFFENR